MRCEIEQVGPKGKITLPEGMSLEQASSAISAEQELRTYGEKVVTIVETINRFPFEAAIALKKAAEEIHGATIQHDKQLPDGSFISAKLIGVPISINETVQVFWGPFHLPDIEGEFETKSAVDNGQLVMKLEARVKRKYADQVKKLVDRAREIAEAESIYKGKAIKVSFYDEKGELSVSPPQFMDLSEDHRVILSEKVQKEINVNILMPIRKSELARQLKVPTKRGTILYGTYGCGKTLIAYMLAKECVAAGRTFVYVEKAIELPEALRFAYIYGPSFVFGEDVDRVTFGPRTEVMDKLLNTVDGVDTKNADVMTALTTNNLGMIHPAFLREGRSDAIIKIDETDSNSAAELLRHFSAGLLEENANLGALSGKMAKKTPAFVREVVERSKLEFMYYNDTIYGKFLTVKDLDLAYHEHSNERAVVDQAIKQGDMIRQMIDQIQQAGGKARLEFHDPSQGI